MRGVGGLQLTRDSKLCSGNVRSKSGGDVEREGLFGPQFWAVGVWVCLCCFSSFGDEASGGSRQLGKEWESVVGGALRRETTGELRGRSVAEEKGVGCLAQTPQVVNCEGKEEDFCIKDCLGKISTCDSSLRVVVLCARELVDFTVKVGPVQG